ncbi:HK97-gp10 family putative phage morphogenesis protein [Clostridium perfringens]|uniref:Phage protein, HK97 gp10 family n=2 Tax=Clostridiaceae TaxID=31979 RepID=A0A1M6NLG9_9CLOT|nr:MULTISPECIES: HK97-gp10 family putative phage morphogenesis protein [Clostridiaceae]CDM68545.1 phage protein, HK97 gp10 family [Clostridium bornimense]SHJ96392.1 phage protein, HK97 gp10 family [Hathewaya proteolytica DSM 3090]HEL1311865.1 HK97 gp10 family phage protein [Streptococcus equi subsp. zooepidemicus]
MAKVDVRMPEEFLLKVSKLAEQTDVIIPKVLEVGGEVVLAKVKDNLRSVVGKGTKYPSKSTGELVSSLGVTSAKQDRKGNYNVKVGFSEPRSDGGSNAKIANIIEYGKHGQPARPFLKPAKSKSRKQCVEAMIAKLEEEINSL